MNGLPAEDWCLTQGLKVNASIQVDNTLANSSEGPHQEQFWCPRDLNCTENDTKENKSFLFTVFLAHF